ncbi:MAG TPA: SCO family protein [Candidatus Binatia bacterium]
MRPRKGEPACASSLSSLFYRFSLYTNGKLIDKLLPGKDLLMNTFKYRFILLGLMVAALGIVIGIFLWIKLAPHARFSASQRSPLAGISQYGPVPEFSLKERSGKTVGLEQLRGTIWIADFIYTDCQDTCPLQSAEMAKLQDELAAQKVKLLSFSVNPGKDTPSVLSQYADRFRASSDRWLFLTGGQEEIKNLVQNGFRLSVATASTDPGVILHSPRFVLIDRQAQIRGYYDSRDNEALQRLRRDVAILARG